MNLRHRFAAFVRGWLPKEPNSTRKTLRIKAFAKNLRRKPLTMRERVVGGLGGAGGALVLMGILNVLSSRYPKSYIVAEEAVGWLLVSLAFSVWITEKNKKISVKKSALNAFREEKIEP